MPATILAMKKILIIGSGNMGTAIADGITSKKLCKKKDIILIEDGKFFVIPRLRNSGSK